MAEEKKAEKGAKKPAKADKPKKPKKNPFKSVVSFFKSVNAERKKVVWPTAKETVKNAAIVLMVAVIVGVAIYVVDSALSLGMKQLRNLAPEKTTISATVDDDKDGEDKDADGKDEGTTGDSTEGTTGDTAENTTGGSTEGTTGETTENTTGE